MDKCNEFSESKTMTYVAVLAALFITATYLHNAAKTIAVEKQYAQDFAHYYFFSSLLNKDVNIYKQTPADLAVLKQSFTLPVPPAGKAEYSSFFFLFMTPFTHFSFWTADYLWFAIKQVALLACLWLTAVLIIGETRTVARWAAICIVFLASQPLLEDLSYGNINVFILLALIIMAAKSHEKENSALSGILLAAILLVKPQFGLLFFFFLLKKDFRVCLSAFVSYAIFRVIGIGVYGLDIEAAYWHNLARSSTSYGFYTNNVSLCSMLSRPFFGALPPLLLFRIYCIIALAPIYITLRGVYTGKKGSFLTQYCLVLCTILLVSPLTEEHHLVITSLAFIALLYDVHVSRLTFAMTAAAFCLIMARYSLNSFTFFNYGLPSLLASGKTLGLLLLWGVLFAASSGNDKSGSRELYRTT